MNTPSLNPHEEANDPNLYALGLRGVEQLPPNELRKLYRALDHAAEAVQEHSKVFDVLWGACREIFDYVTGLEPANDGEACMKATISALYNAAVTFDDAIDINELRLALRDLKAFGK